MDVWRPILAGRRGLPPFLASEGGALTRGNWPRRCPSTPVSVVAARSTPQTGSGAILDWCHRQGARTVVFKLGKAGSWVSDGADRRLIPAFQVNAIDATGAGDCFDGSLLARLVAGDDCITAARWASAAAAITTTGYGAVAPLPTAERVAQFLTNAAQSSTESERLASK